MATSNDTTLKKTCKSCGREFPATVEYFHLHAPGKYGLRARCRECICAEKRAYRAANPEKARASVNAYHAAHKEELAAKQAVYYAEHREERLTYLATWQATHQEEMAAYRASLRGKELNRIHNHNRRALERIAGDKITPDEYAAVLAAHKNKKGQIICAWCGKPVGEEWHYDHWIPLDKGGRHEAGNLRVMHGKDGDKCNLHKGATHPFKFGKLI
jgi:HNH endonuclease